MEWLREHLNGLAVWLLAELGKLLNNITGTVSWVLASLIGLVVLPVSWIFDAASYYLDYAISAVRWLGSQVDQLGLSQMGGEWGQLGQYLNQANTVFPLDTLLFCVGGLLALRGVALLVRIAIRLIPTMG